MCEAFSVGCFNFVTWNPFG